jgi:Spy/CpxP family protein refolding chaperone
MSWPNEHLATLNVQTKPNTEEIMRTNKLMLVATMALGVLLACGTSAMAQDNKEGKGGKRGRMSAEERLKQMDESLKLTEAQKPKVKAALEDTQTKMQEARTAPQEERGEKMRTIMADETKKMKEILTPEQFTKYEEMRPARGGGKKKGDSEKKE